MVRFDVGGIWGYIVRVLFGTSKEFCVLLSPLFSRCLYHPPGMRRACPVCRKVLSSKYALQIHLRDVHAEARRNFSCSFCNKSYASENSYRVHMSLKHRNNAGRGASMFGGNDGANFRIGAAGFSPPQQFGGQNVSGMSAMLASPRQDTSMPYSSQGGGLGDPFQAQKLPTMKCSPKSVMSPEFLDLGHSSSQEEFSSSGTANKTLNPFGSPPPAQQHYFPNQLNSQQNNITNFQYQASPNLPPH